MMAFVALKDIIKIPKERLAKLYPDYETLAAGINNVRSYMYSDNDTNIISME